MRDGRNPLDGMKVTPMPGIVGCVITHLPVQAGYHKGRFEVIKLCLNSMRKNAGRRLPMCIWDNGSCQEFRLWLLNDFKPDFLTFSANVGKSSARTAMLRTFPPETVVCLSDDDMLYYPGWLEPQLKLLNGFPDVGVVSGYPVRTQFRWGIVSNLKFAAEHPKEVKVTRGRLIPESEDIDFCESVGRVYSDHLKMTRKDEDILFEYKGLRAYATAHHCQFIAYAGRIENIVEWSDFSMPDEKMFDHEVDNAGWLRLTTTERLVRHMGNVMEKKFQEVLK